MKKRKLNYRFHNPNPAAVAADYILQICIEANAKKVETAIQKATEGAPLSDEKPNCCQGRPV